MIGKTEEIKRNLIESLCGRTYQSITHTRQLLWHRHRKVQTRTRIMNQLQAVAINEGVGCKKRLWREAGRKQLESLPLAQWASRRRQDLLEVLDRIHPTIAELTQAIEDEVEKCSAARRLMTHPGVGALTVVLLC